MNIKTSATVTVLSFLFLAGPVMAEMQQNQSRGSTSFVQTDESADFAAYEFEDKIEINKTNRNTRKVSESGDDSNEWTPDYWTEIQ